MSSLFKSLSKKTVMFVDKVKMTEHFFMIGAAILIGLLAGFGAIGIRALIHEVSSLSYVGDGTLLENIKAAPWYIKILIPALGGLIVGPIIYFFAPEAKGHGVPEVMQSLLLKGGVIRPRVAIIKAFASSITIGTGGSVGREGPIIQIGSSIGSTVGQLFRVPTRRMKTLVGCGAAAGIAAAFNAPIAGALFAVEIILMDFKAEHFSPIVIASVMATVVSHQFEGNLAAFAVPAYHLQSPYEILFYFALGIITGLISWLFIKVLYYSEDFWETKVKIPEWSKAAIGGVMIGVMALIVPQIMGVGYETITNALNGNFVWYMALLLVFVKIISTSITLGSGGSGGIFAPALFMGALVGVFFGIFVHQLFPSITAEPGAYALVAMGGLVAGTTRAPITAIIIVFELTKDYEIVLPLMIVCIISTILSSKLSRESIYTLKLLLRKINLKDSAESNVMKSLLVKDVCCKDFETVSERTNFSDIVNMIVAEKRAHLSVTNAEGKFRGIISIHNIKEYLLDKDALKFVLLAGDICDAEVFCAKPEDDCKHILEEMSKCDYDVLPILNKKGIQTGVIKRKDIDEAHSKEMEYIELTSGLAEKITMHNAENDVRFMEGYVMSEIDTPSMFVGKSIKDLGIRPKYGVEILSIKGQSKSGHSITVVPKADYVFKSDDRIIIAGKTEQIIKMKNL